MKLSTDPRHQARRLALAQIYSQEIKRTRNDTSLTKLETSLTGLDIKSYDNTFFTKLYNGVKENRKKLLQKIQKHSIDWEIGKFYKVDLSTLLISTWELLYGKAPKKVVIDEAVELAKEFGGKDSSRFVNGILAGIVAEIGNEKEKVPNE